MRCGRIPQAAGRTSPGTTPIPADSTYSIRVSNRHSAIRNAPNCFPYNTNSFLIVTNSTFFRAPSNLQHSRTYSLQTHKVNRRLVRFERDVSPGKQSEEPPANRPSLGIFSSADCGPSIPLPSHTSTTPLCTKPRYRIQWELEFCGVCAATPAIQHFSTTFALGEPVRGRSPRTGGDAPKKKIWTLRRS
jgi:hypothetical protein